MIGYLGAFAAGLFFAITPIPALPFLIFAGAVSAWRTGIFWGLVAIVGGFGGTLLPFIFIWLAYERTGMAGAIIFAASMYSIAIWGVMEKVMSWARS